MGEALLTIWIMLVAFGMMFAGGCLVLLISVIRNLERKVDYMSEALDRLRDEVSQLSEVNVSAITLITGLADQIRNAVDDSDALNELADTLDAQSNQLADAVAANTPTVTTNDTGDNGPPPKR